MRSNWNLFSWNGQHAGQTAGLLFSVCPKTPVIGIRHSGLDPESMISREIKYLDTGFRGMTSQRGFFGQTLFKKSAACDWRRVTQKGKY